MINAQQPKTKDLPKHVAFIMDGNRRWAKKHKLSIIAGHHKAAFETIEPLIDFAIKRGIAYVTFWAFSTENWSREAEEVNGLLNLFREALSDNINKLYAKGAQMRAIGDITKFPSDISRQIIDGVEKTRKNSRIVVTFALNYGGRDEIIRAIRTLPNTNYPLQNITSENLSTLLDTVHMPDPDLLIRTGGEQRLSGFLAWQSVYSELYFTDVLFPDFTPDEFEKALVEYQRRQRRFGR